MARTSIKDSQCAAGTSKVWNYLKAHSENVLLVLLIFFMGIGILMGLLLRGVNPPLNAQQVCM